MEKGILKGLCKIIYEQVINPKEIGYEMGCLISSEFTPAPDYSDLDAQAQELCLKYKVDYHEFHLALKQHAQNEQGPNPSELWYLRSYFYQATKDIIPERLRHVVSNIPYITDVDFVPDTDEEYEALPEPWRTDAIVALGYRQNNWNELVAARKKHWE